MMSSGPDRENQNQSSQAMRRVHLNIFVPSPVEVTQVLVDAESLSRQTLSLRT